MEQVDPDRLVFLDESGLDTRLTRAYARAPRGRRAVGRIPGGRWRRLTILGAIACDGLVAVMTVAAATSTAVVLAFVEGLLIPAPRARPEVLVGMDNLAPHRAAAVRDALRRADLAHRYLPAYSPDMNHRRRRSPGGADREAVWRIEPAWAKPKLRAVAPRTIEALDAALPDALRSITPDNARAWFRYCGYHSTCNRIPL
jgi:hypothetical protein